MKWLVGVLSILSFLLFAPQAQAISYCSYDSTQARVQNNIRTPWSTSIQVGCERSFNVGSFHNGIDRFAEDTVLQVVGPQDFIAFYNNGDTVRVPRDGHYTLYVNTRDTVGSACFDSARVEVRCDRDQANSCQYQSTQARVQQDIEHDWVRELELRCGQSFNVGSFHNGIARFAEDTEIRVTGPFWLNHTFRNAERIRALFPGTYRVQVTTPGKSGAACREEAVVNVECSWDWWRD